MLQIFEDFYEDLEGIFYALSELNIIKKMKRI